MQCSMKEKSQTLNGFLSVIYNLPTEFREVGTESSLALIVLLLNFCFESLLVSKSQGSMKKKKCSSPREMTWAV